MLEQTIDQLGSRVFLGAWASEWIARQKHL